MSRLRLTVSFVVAAVLSAGPSLAAQQTVLGKRLQIKNPSADATKRKVSVSAQERPSPNTIVGNPTQTGATLQVIANGGTDSNQTFLLPSSNWSAISSIGYKFTNRGLPDNPVKRVQIKKTPSGIFSIKTMISGRYGTLNVVPPNPGDNGGIVLTITGGDGYCVAFGGAAGGTEQRDTAQVWQVKSPTAELCPAPGGGGTTTTTTTSGSTSTTGSTGPTTSTTSTTAASTTTTTLAGSCDCCAYQRLAFTTTAPQINMDPPCGNVAPGACADNPIGNACNTNADCSTGECRGDLDCGGLYIGGSGVQVPLPFSVPDSGSSILDVVGCTPSGNSGSYTLAASSPGETPNITIRNCTDGHSPNPDYPQCVGGTFNGKPCHSDNDCTLGSCSGNLPGCLFGSPLPLPNATTSGTSTCVINRIATDATGTGDCGGASSVSLPLSSDTYLTGDSVSNVPGIQPCPICTGTPGSETCKGGPNNGLGCTPANAASLGAAYPTSHDCPPAASAFLGTLAVPFALTTSAVSKTATDTDGTGPQTLVFCGFCRSATPPNSGNFESPAHPCTSSAQCTTAGFTTCEQRTEGAFGNGIGMTITENGAPGGCLADGSGHAAKLVSVFCIPPSFNGLVDGAADLPGPGAVSLPGNAQLIDLGTTTTSTTVLGSSTTNSTVVTTTTVTSSTLAGCGLTFPTCGGSCGPGDVCSMVIPLPPDLAGCQCIPASPGQGCNQADFPTCDGTACPVGSSCMGNPGPAGGCACIPGP